MAAITRDSRSLADDWPLIRLGTLLAEVSDKVGRAGETEIPVLSMTRYSGLILQSSKFEKRVASRDISSYKIVRLGQIVVGFPIDEGVVYALRRFAIGAVSPAYQVWQVTSDDVDVEFLDVMLKTPLMIDRYRQLSTTTVQRRRNISKRDFLDLEIPLPPLPEQRRIAAVLNAIQDAIAAQEDVIAAARAFKRSLMRRLFTYGPGREPAPTKETEIGEIPAHWEVVRFEQVVDEFQNGLYKPADCYGEGTPILRIDAYEPGDVISSQQSC